MKIDKICQSLIKSGKLSDLKIALKALKLGLSRVTTDMLVHAFLNLGHFRDALVAARRGKASPSMVGLLVLRTIASRGMDERGKNRNAWIASYAARLHCPRPIRLKAVRYFLRMGRVNSALAIAEAGKISGKTASDVLNKAIAQGNMRVLKRAAALLKREPTSEELRACGKNIMSRIGWIDDKDCAALRQSGISSEEIGRTVLHHIRKGNFEAAFCLSQTGISPSIAEKLIEPAFQINDSWLGTLEPMVKSVEVLQRILCHYIDGCWCQSAQKIAGRLGRTLTSAECNRGVKRSLRGGFLKNALSFAEAGERELTRRELSQLLTAQCKKGMPTEDKLATIKLLGGDRESLEIVLRNALNKGHIGEVLYALQKLGRPLSEKERNRLANKLGRGGVVFLDERTMGVAIRLLGNEVVTFRRRLVLRGSWWGISELVKQTGVTLTETERKTLRLRVVGSGNPDVLGCIKDFSNRKLTKAEIARAINASSKNGDNYRTREIIKLFC
jgi:hypothetical protein